MGEWLPPFWWTVLFVVSILSTGSVFVLLVVICKHTRQLSEKQSSANCLLQPPQMTGGTQSSDQKARRTVTRIHWCSHKWYCSRKKQQVHHCVNSNFVSWLNDPEMPRKQHKATRFFQVFIARFSRHDASFWFDKWRWSEFSSQLWLLCNITALDLQKHSQSSHNFYNHRFSDLLDVITVRIFHQESNGENSLSGNHEQGEKQRVTPLLHSCWTNLNFVRSGGRKSPAIPYRSVPGVQATEWIKQIPLEAINMEWPSPEVNCLLSDCTKALKQEPVKPIFESSSSAIGVTICGCR